MSIGRRTIRLLHGKIALPILGRRYGEALAAGEIALHWENGNIFVRYFDHFLPLDAESAVAGAQALDDGLDPASEADASACMNCSRASITG